MNLNAFARAVRGLYYRQRLLSDRHRLENEVKTFLRFKKMKRITVSSLKVELKRGRLQISKIEPEDDRQLKLNYEGR